MFVTYWHSFGHFVMFISETHNQVLQLPVQLPGRKNGRKLVRAITAESIYRCMLLFLDHILFRRAHFVRDARTTSPAVLAIKTKMKTVEYESHGQAVHLQNDHTRKFNLCAFCGYKHEMNKRCPACVIIDFGKFCEFAWAVLFWILFFFFFFHFDTFTIIHFVYCLFFCVSYFFYMLVCLFVLRFYGPVNPMGSCRARSVYLTTRYWTGLVL